jgi:hypothetical protein
MPLDPIRGETFDGLNTGPHLTIPPRLLADLSNLQTEYTLKSRFISKSAKKRTRPVFDDAVANAIEAFADKGALRPIRFDADDVVVQVYPHDFKVAVIFQRSIAGTVHYSTSFYDLPPAALACLLDAAGKRAPATH